MPAMLEQVPFEIAFDLKTSIVAAQNGDQSATEDLLLQFRPLLRSRMHALYLGTRSTLCTLEWSDIEAQVTLLFLSRLHAFKPELGVYFPHYIERMLDLDGRAWVRTLRRGEALPFSQLWSPGDEDGDPFDWIEDEFAPDEVAGIERNLALRDALDALSPAHREVVWKCCVLGRTEDSVARELSLSRSAVRNRLDGALGKMRAFFGSDETGTRTGRARPDANQAATPYEEFWQFLTEMTKHEKRPDLVGVGAGRPVLLQGTFDFPATGLKNPQHLHSKLTYTVPSGNVAGIRYARIGVVCDAMVVISTVVNGLPHRLLPVAANSHAHVSFAIVEPLVAGSQIEIHVASEKAGIAIIDVGVLQIPA
jgi:hypothetical protein